MYQVTLFNGDESTVIHALSMEHGANKITGSFKQGINTIDSFTFTIAPENTGFDKINSLTTLVEVLNTRTNIVEFRGRVLLPIPSMNSSGLFQKSVTCESELGYLLDSCTRYGEYHDMSVRDFLNMLLENHNKQVSPDKHFTLGVVEVQANLYRFLDYSKTFESIKDNLLDRLGGELQVRYENGVRYLDYLIERGTTQATEIRLAKNLISVEKELDPTKVITRMLPLGAKLEDSDERLTIKSVNGGKDFIDDEEAIKTFGIIESAVIWDDVTLPDNLIRKAREKFNEVNRVLKKHRVEALDLFTIGLDVAGFNCCDKYPVINPVMDINEVLRVVEKTVDIAEPQNSSLTIGDKFENIKDYNLKVNKATKTVEKLKGAVNGTIDVVTNINVELNQTVEVVNSTIDVLNNTNDNVALINNNLITVNESLQNNIKVTNDLVKTTVSITEKLNETNDRLEKLKKRVIMEV